MPKEKSKKAESSGRSKRTPLTHVEVEAAKRLMHRWKSIPAKDRPTQEKMAELWGEGGSQSLISQYLNGVIALNVTAAIRFGTIFGCKPEEILDVPELAGRPAARASASSQVLLMHAPWPFSIPRERFDRLSHNQKGQIEGVMKRQIEEFEHLANSSREKRRR